MTDLVTMHEFDSCITVSFDAGVDHIMAIGEMMNGICEMAYMNGYNWAAFLTRYLEVNAPDILEVIDTDPEAECYYAYINRLDAEGREIAARLKKLIEDLFSNEEKIYGFLSENADEIEWD